MTQVENTKVKALAAANPFKKVGETKLGIEDFEFCVKNTSTLFLALGTGPKKDEETREAAANCFMRVVSEHITLEELQTPETLGGVVALLLPKFAESAKDEMMRDKCYAELELSDADLAYALAVTANLLGSIYTTDRLFDFAGQMRLLIAGALGTNPEATAILGALWFDIMALTAGGAIGYYEDFAKPSNGPSVSYLITLDGGTISEIKLWIAERETMPGKEVTFERDSDSWCVKFTGHGAFCKRQQELAVKMQEENEKKMNEAIMSDKDAAAALEQAQMVAMQIEEDAVRAQSTAQAAQDRQDAADDAADAMNQAAPQAHVAAADGRDPRLDALAERTEVHNGVTITSKVDIA